MASSELNLPEGMTLDIVTDSSISTQTDRHCSQNAIRGIGACSRTTARVKIAVWVAAGIPIAILGALIVSAIGLTIGSLHDGFYSGIAS